MKRIVPVTTTSSVVRNNGIIIRRTKQSIGCYTNFIQKQHHKQPSSVARVVGLSDRRSFTRQAKNKASSSSSTSSIQHQQQQQQQQQNHVNDATEQSLIVQEEENNTTRIVGGVSPQQQSNPLPEYDNISINNNNNDPSLYDYWVPTAYRKPSSSSSSSYYSRSTNKKSSGGRRTTTTGPTNNNNRKTTTTATGGSSATTGSSSRTANRSSSSSNKNKDTTSSSTDISSKNNNNDTTIGTTTTTKTTTITNKITTTAMNNNEIHQQRIGYRMLCKKEDRFVHTYNELIQLIPIYRTNFVVPENTTTTIPNETSSLLSSSLSSNNNNKATTKSTTSTNNKKSSSSSSKQWVSDFEKRHELSLITMNEIIQNNIKDIHLMIETPIGYEQILASEETYKSICRLIQSLISDGSILQGLSNTYSFTSDPQFIHFTESLVLLLFDFQKGRKLLYDTTKQWTTIPTPSTVVTTTNKKKHKYTRTKASSSSSFQIPPSYPKPKLQQQQQQNDLSESSALLSFRGWIGSIFGDPASSTTTTTTTTRNQYTNDNNDDDIDEFDDHSFDDTGSSTSSNSSSRRILLAHEDPKLHITTKLFRFVINGIASTIHTKGSTEPWNNSNNNNKNNKNNNNANSVLAAATTRPPNREDYDYAARRMIQLLDAIPSSFLMNSNNNSSKNITTVNGRSQNPNNNNNIPTTRIGFVPDTFTQKLIMETLCYCGTIDSARLCNQLFQNSITQYRLPFTIVLQSYLEAIKNYTSQAGGGGTTTSSSSSSTKSNGDTTNNTKDDELIATIQVVLEEAIQAMETHWEHKPTHHRVERIMHLSIILNCMAMVASTYAGTGTTFLMPSSPTLNNKTTIAKTRAGIPPPQPHDRHTLCQTGEYLARRCIGSIMYNQLRAEIVHNMRTTTPSTTSMYKKNTRSSSIEAKESIYTQALPLVNYLTQIYASEAISPSTIQSSEEIVEADTGSITEEHDSSIEIDTESNKTSPYKRYSSGRLFIAKQMLQYMMKQPGGVYDSFGVGGNDNEVDGDGGFSDVVVERFTALYPDIETINAVLYALVCQYEGRSRNGIDPSEAQMDLRFVMDLVVPTLLRNPDHAGWPNSDTFPLLFRFVHAVQPTISSTEMNIGRIGENLLSMMEMVRFMTQYNNNNNNHLSKHRTANNNSSRSSNMYSTTNSAYLSDVDLPTSFPTPSSSSGSDSTIISITLSTYQRIFAFILQAARAKPSTSTGGKYYVECCERAVRILDRLDIQSKPLLLSTQSIYHIINEQHNTVGIPTPQTKLYDTTLRPSRRTYKLILQICVEAATNASNCIPPVVSSFHETDGTTTVTNKPEEDNNPIIDENPYVEQIVALAIHVYERMMIRPDMSLGKDMEHFLHQCLLKISSTSSLRPRLEELLAISSSSSLSSSSAAGATKDDNTTNLEMAV